MNEEPELPLDERFNEAKQHAFDFTPVPQPQPLASDYVKPCDSAVFCYCPKCNPR
jgi:hypothetical protein